MFHILELAIKPFSINAYHYADKRHKTKEAKDWEMQVFHLLNIKSNQNKLEELRNFFKPELHLYFVKIICFYPNNEFYTKSNIISQRTIDITNFEKPIIDLLFLPKHFDNPYPYGCKNLNIDDKYLWKISSQKMPHNNQEYIIKIYIKIIKGPYPLEHK